MAPDSAGAGRTLVGNLDVETELAAWLAREEDRRAPRALPRRLQEALAAFSTLLRVFARSGDVLATIVAVDPARLSAASGLAVPRLVVAKGAAATPGGAVLAWSRVAWTRTRGAPDVEPIDSGSDAHPLGPLERLWRTPALPPRVVAAANHRRLSLRLRAELGVALPGEAEVDSLSALAAHLGEHARDTEYRWVAKAPLSAAGRARVHGRGPTLDAPALGGVAALLAEHGSVLVEPWMARELDVGRAAYLDASGLAVLGTHRLLVDGGGRFRAVVAADAGDAGLTPQEETALDEALARAGLHLASVGYRGPLGVDAWRYRDATGARRFQPLGEINARLTFGHLAHAYRARLIARGVLAPGTPLALHLRAEPGAAPPETTDARRVWPLLLAARSGSSVGAAWLETTEASGSGDG